MRACRLEKCYHQIYHDNRCVCIIYQYLLNNVAQARTTRLLEEQKQKKTDGYHLIMHLLLQKRTTKDLYVYDEMYYDKILECAKAHSRESFIFCLIKICSHK